MKTTQVIAIVFDTSQKCLIKMFFRAAGDGFVPLELIDIQEFLPAKSKEQLVLDVVGVSLKYAKRTDETLFVVGTDTLLQPIGQNAIALKQLESGFAVARFCPVGKRENGQIFIPGMTLGAEDSRWQFVYTGSDEIDFFPSEVLRWKRRAESI